MLVDHDSGLVLDMALAPQEKWQKTLQTKLLAHIDTSKTIPARMLVQREEVAVFLPPILSMLNVELSIIKSLKNIDGFRKALLQQFKG